MGCSISNESVQKAAEDEKDDVKDAVADIKNVTSANLTADKSVQPTELNSSGKNHEAEETTLVNGEKEASEVSDEGGKTGFNEEEAATRIQAVFRGHHARKSMKETETTQQKGTNAGTDNEPTQEELQEEFRADDKDLCNAATKIQASFRGHMSRKEQAAGSVVKAVGGCIDNMEAKIDQHMDDALNELDGIDLTDPDLHKAATKIQASFRGHKVRQEVTPGTEDKK